MKKLLELLSQYKVFKVSVLQQGESLPPGAVSVERPDCTLLLYFSPEATEEEKIQASNLASLAKVKLRTKLSSYAYLVRQMRNLSTPERERLFFLSAASLARKEQDLVQKWKVNLNLKEVVLDGAPDQDTEPPVE